uniref:CSON014764 protein n=1 Tax=Culicoides sonorensis TaxID=179676 RepID=A0A336MBR8_CULSO
MFSHNYSVFANNCVKPPLHSSTKLPNPSYLKPKCAMKDNSNKTKNSNLKKCKKFSSLLSLTAENNNFLSLRDFYDSIPDYNELHHLSQCDFYKELDTLKRKRNELRSSIFGEDYFQGSVWHKVDTPETNLVSDPCSITPNYNCIGSSKHFNDFSSCKFNEYTPRIASADMKLKSTRKGSAKSVRIEADPVPYITPHDDNSTRIFKKSLRAKSASPVRENPVITVTEPFKMTQREDDEKTFDDLLFESKEFLSPEKPSKPVFTTSPSRFKANPVPITSKIPLFKQIMEDKEHKSQLAKLDSAMELNEKIKPFGFDNGPDRPHSRCLSRSLSSPHINLTPEPVKPFKANPVPKTSNTNYFQSKMTEEEYFRDMNKRVRAEELLKMASLPPSMKRREKSEKKSFEMHSCSSQSTKRPKRKRKTKKSRILSSSTNKTSNSSFSTAKNEFITTCPHPFDLMTSKRPEKDRLRKTTPTPTNSSSKSNSTFSFKSGPSPSPMYPVNRPNLAATLRYEHSRNKIKEYKERAASSLSGTVKTYRWNVQKTPGWQSLSMDPTHAEELQLRLATRRAEQKLRQEEYKMSKELMIQRVKAAPLLLEGPSFWGPKVGQLSHHCGTENNNERSGRSRPGRWQSLSMDPTHAEELQLRLATRRAEQKLRQEEYKMSKELMIQRVKAAPLLLEGPSFWGPKVGQLSHHCGTENNNERSGRSRPGSCMKRPTSSKMSNYSLDSKSTNVKVIDLSGKQSVEFDDDYYENSNSEIE